MENNYRFDYHQHLNMLSHDPYLSGFPFDIGYLNADPVHRNPLMIENFTSTDLLSFPFSGLQQLKANKPNNSQNCIHVKPHIRQASAPLLNTPASLFNFGQQINPTIGTQPAQKKFLVFNQSGDKTTVLYSSRAHTPFQFGAYGVPNPPTTRNLREQSNTNNHLRPSMNDKNIEDHSRDVTQVDMREDSEELDALLCSDYDDDFLEDDELSTGHSPSTMTDNSVLNRVEETFEEVDSFLVPTKKRKLLDGCYDAPAFKTVDCSALESDAESSCGKRSRNVKIHETVSILRSIIPNAYGKDGIVVIDEAICYLKYLKEEALKDEVKALTLDPFE